MMETTKIVLLLAAIALLLGLAIWWSMKWDEQDDFWRHWDD